MTDLTALRERIEARKAQAKAVRAHAPAPWTYDPVTELIECANDGGAWYAHGVNEDTNVFIAAHDPASVIADCDADLTLLDAAVYIANGHPLGYYAVNWALANVVARYPEQA